MPTCLTDFIEPAEDTRWLLPPCEGLGFCLSVPAPLPAAISCSPRGSTSTNMSCAVLLTWPVQAVLQLLMLHALLLPPPSKCCSCSCRLLQVLRLPQLQRPCVLGKLAPCEPPESMLFADSLSRFLCMLNGVYPVPIALWLLWLGAGAGGMVTCRIMPARFARREQT
jgi:hypothetical protein